MYSWEIQQLMEIKNYLLLVEEYLFILETSPQIMRCTYNPFSDNYKMITSDGYEWNFKTRKGK